MVRLGLLKDNSFSLLSAVLLLKVSSGILLTRVAGSSATTANRLVHPTHHLSLPHSAVRWPVIIAEAPDGILLHNYRRSGRDVVLQWWCTEPRR